MLNQIHNKISIQLTSNLKADLDNIQSDHLIDINTKFIMYLNIKYTDLTIIEIEEDLLT